MNCPLCEAKQSRMYSAWPDFTVRQCGGCGFRFVDVTAPGYPIDAQYRFDEPIVGSVRSDWPHIRRRVEDVMRYRPPPTTAIDIGCGKGEFIAAMAARGYQCVGIDMNMRRITNARMQFPEIEWRQGTTHELQREPRRFDIVTMYHVLEHIPDPRAALADAKALGLPGALLVIEVPNVGGFESRLKGRHWHYYKVDHVNYFKTRDLLRLADMLNLRVLGVRNYQHFSFPQDVVWKDAVKRALGWVGFNDVTSVFLEVK